MSVDTLTVVPGEIRMNVADLVVDERHSKVWHIDLVSKYAEILAYAMDHEASAIEVLVNAGERTLGVDQDRAGVPTTFRFQLPQGDEWDWNVLAECARYTLRVSLYRQHRAGGDS